MPINHVTGDATQPVGQGPKILVHCCNDQGAWGRGFVVALSRMWPQAETSYRAWFSNNLGDDGDDIPSEETGPPQLGEVQFVLVAPKLWVANLIGQHGIGMAEDRRAPIRYDAVRKGFIKLTRQSKIYEASVHMPRMGTGLAGGSWKAIEQLVQAELLANGVAVTVYSLPEEY